MRNRVKKTDLIVLAKEIESKLKEEGFDVESSPYFAYGAYGYYFDFNLNTEGKYCRQYVVGLGTKQECLEELQKVYRNVLAREKHYKNMED